MANLIKDPMMMREIILDHYEYPRHHYLERRDSYSYAHMASESCIDDLHLQARIENGIIEDVGFSGTLCAISTASTSIMTELVSGRTVEEANVIIDNYLAMLDGREYDEDLLEEANALSGVSKQANRIKCATIGWHGLQQLIAESEEKTDAE